MPVGAGEVFVAGDGDEGTPEFGGHRFDQTGLAAPRRAFHQHRQLAGVGGPEQGLLVSGRQVRRRHDRGVGFSDCGHRLLSQPDQVPIMKGPGSPLRW